MDTGAARRLAADNRAGNFNRQAAAEMLDAMADALDAARAELARSRAYDAERTGYRIRAEAAEAEAARLRGALPDRIELGDIDYAAAAIANVAPGAHRRLTDVARRIRSALDAGAVATWTRERDDAHRLAMLALQSERYASDADYRGAVDAVLAAGHPPVDTGGPT